MASFTLFIVLPTEEICTLRRITSGVSVKEIKSMLEVSAGLPSQIYNLISSRHHNLNDDYVLELHHNVWNGFLYRVDVKEAWRTLFAAVVKEDIDWLLRKEGVCVTSGDVYNAKNHHSTSLDVEERGSVALYLASWLGSRETCQTLLSVGVNPNGATRNNRTPLFAAVARDNLRVVDVLLNHGAKLSVRDCNRDTSLDIARRNSAKQCIKRILSAQNISIYNLKGKDRSSCTETDIAIPKVENGVGLENTALVELPQKRPFTSPERTNTGCGYTLQVKPNTNLPRRSTAVSSRSVMFKLEKDHSLQNRNDRNLLPDVHLRTPSAYVRTPIGVSFSEHRSCVTRIAELSEGNIFRATKYIPKLALGKMWSTSKDVVTWKNSTTGLEFFDASLVFGKPKSGMKCGHLDPDINTAVESDQSHVVKNIYPTVPAQTFIIPQNKQNDDAKDLDFNIRALNLSTAENKQSKVDKKTDRVALALSSTTAESEHSEVSRKIDHGDYETNQDEVLNKIDYCALTLNSSSETEQSGDIKGTDCNINGLNVSRIENEPNVVDNKTDCGALTLNSTLTETEQSEVAKKTDYDTLVLNLRTVETEQSDGVKSTEHDTPPKSTAEAPHYAGATSTDADTHSSNDADTNSANDADTHSANDADTHSANDAYTHSANDADTHSANGSDGNVDSESNLCGDNQTSLSSNLCGDNETNISSTSVTDARPKTANCSFLRGTQLHCKSAGLVRTAARQIKIAEHRKRIQSASDKSMETIV